MPKLYRAWNSLGSTGRINPHLYRSLPSISLDYAVMEKMRNVHCLEVPFEWRDVGGWSSLAEFWPADKTGNRIRGKNVLCLDSSGNIVKSKDRLIALLGVHDFVIVDTPDALLVCRRSETERLRAIVEALEKRKSFRYL